MKKSSSRKSSPKTIGKGAPATSRGSAKETAMGRGTPFTSRKSAPYKSRTYSKGK